MEEQNIRMAIDRHWAASAAGDQVAEHEIYHDDIVCEYPQSGEVIRGRPTLCGRPYLANTTGKCRTVLESRQKLHCSQDDQTQRSYRDDLCSFTAAALKIMSDRNATP